MGITRQASFLQQSVLHKLKLLSMGWFEFVSSASPVQLVGASPPRYLGVEERHRQHERRTTLAPHPAHEKLHFSERGRAVLHRAQLQPVREEPH